MLHELNRVQRQLPAELAHMFRLMETSTTPTVKKATTIIPKMNIVATDRSIEVYAIAAGIDAESLDVTIDNNILTISGELKGVNNVTDKAEEEKPEENSQQNRPATKTKLLLNEYTGGTFKRSITLPEEVDSTKVEATLEQGILHLSILKKETAKPQKITVKVA